MAVFKESKYFIRKNITPGTLLPNNLISFSYKSPAGIHDKTPLVFVLESRVDRIFGINIHYDMAEMDSLLQNQIIKVQQAIELEWYKKYPSKKIELKKNNQAFDITMIDKKDVLQLTRRLQRPVVEQFQIDDIDFKNALRCYLFSRMTRVSKLVWKF